MEQELKAKTGGWRSFLAVVLAASLALGLMPAGATEAYAATKTKSYVYDVVYGTYQGKYAIGFKQGKGSDEVYTFYDVADVISADKGATIKVKASNFPGHEWEIRSWANDLQAWGARGWNPAVITVPFKSKGKVKFRAYTLAGKKVSNAIYDGMGFYTDGNPANSHTILYSGVGTKTLKLDFYNCKGEKSQSITLANKGMSEYLVCYPQEVNGSTYLFIEDGDKSHYYKLKKGKFVACSNPWSSNDSYGYVGDGVYLREEEGEYVEGLGWPRDFYLEDSKGKRTPLPRITKGGVDYSVVEDLGVCADDGQKTYIYGKTGKLLGTLPICGWVSKTDVPGIWACGSLAFNSSLKIVAQEKGAFYPGLLSAGKLNKKSLYALPLESGGYVQRWTYVDGSLKRVKARGYALESTLAGATPVHTFKNGRQVVVAKNSSGKFGVVDTKGNVLIPFSYSDFYDSGTGDYVMMKKGKSWQFVKVSHLASGKAVKGGVYTVGKLKYKVTSTAKKSAAVTVVGHAKGAKATGKVTVPSTVKIAGQKFKVTAIGSKAFKGSKVSSVTIGKYVTTIGTGAFYGCTSLKAATLGASTKTLGKDAFSGCKSLLKITVKSKALKSVGKNAIKNINKKAKIKVPKSKVKQYKKLFKSKTGFKRTMKVTK